MGNVNSVYRIIAQFTGVDGVVGGFGRIQGASNKTTQTITAGAKAQKKALQELRDEHARLQKSLRQDLAVVGIGAAGMGLFVKGVKVASDFESSLTERRLSIQRLGKDGSLDVSLLNAQMGELEALGVRLGNTLPGSTKDFIDMFISLRQGGIDVKSILGGAGEAVADLAVIAKETPADLAKAYAQLGLMYKLKPEE